MQQPNLVSLQKCLSYDVHEIQPAIERALDPWGGLAHFVKKGARVLLKPNLLFGRPPEQAVTTHPAMIECIAQMVLDCDATVFIGDSPPLFSATRTLHKCGMDDMVKRLGIHIIEFDRPTLDGWHPQVHTQGVATPPISAVLQDMDVVINLPKLKAHQQLAITGAVKNLFGCVVGRKKAYWHFKLQKSVDSFARMLLALNEKIAPALTVVDAVVAMEGKGPGNGNPAPVGLIAAGQDTVALDRVLAELVGLDVQEHFVLRNARQLGFASAKLESIPLAGVSLDEAAFPSFIIPEIVPIGFSLVHILKGIMKYITLRRKPLETDSSSPLRQE